jgi:hypothetical protein
MAAARHLAAHPSALETASISRRSRTKHRISLPIGQMGNGCRAARLLHFRVPPLGKSVLLYVQYGIARHVRPRKERLEHTRPRPCIRFGSGLRFRDRPVAIDRRREYGETRYIAIGMLGARIHVLCFAEVPDGIRVISFRKANLREARRYGEAQTSV